MRTVLVRAEEAKHIKDALCIKMHPHMDPAPIIFAPLTLLPTKVFWEKPDFNHLAPTEAASDDGSDRPMAAVVDGTEMPVVGVSSMTVSAPAFPRQVSAVPVAAPGVAPTANAVPFMAPVVAPYENTVPVTAPVIAAPLHEKQTRRNQHVVPRTPHNGGTPFGGSMARNVDVVESVSHMPVAREPITGIVEVGTFSVRFGSLTTAYPGLHGR